MAQETRIPISPSRGSTGGGTVVTLTGTAVTGAAGSTPYGVAVSPDGTKAYVTLSGSNAMAVVGSATNTVVGSPVTIGISPRTVAFTPDRTRAYVAKAAPSASASARSAWRSPRTARTPTSPTRA
ncbi:IPT/TIG domain-containing protein [Streptomyces sp. SL13]|uniref:IPT/TIG domain-containing protein n=1 Tax=Streptantibioticus silvisoli TaxID=2705255 RepID=A0AA90GYY9_9ACTN|nr:IPT/TIG domain-containing protein [Streptantibioticus silvisoli]MDI5970848.1 IPT/TIG domain-containing protein [Streptantibioticus silvisoli]